MAIEGRTLKRALPAVRLPVPTPEGVAKAMVAPFAAAGRVLLGPARGPRGYRREGFPESELYRIMSGRQDRFEGL